MLLYTLLVKHRQPMPAICLDTRQKVKSKRHLLLPAPACSSLSLLAGSLGPLVHHADPHTHDRCTLEAYILQPNSYKQSGESLVSKRCMLTGTQ